MFDEMSEARSDGRTLAIIVPLGPTGQYPILADLVNDAGLAYQLRRAGDTLETIIYQPSRAEVRRLAVNTACVF